MSKKTVRLNYTVSAFQDSVNSHQLQFTVMVVVLDCQAYSLTTQSSEFYTAR